MGADFFDRAVLSVPSKEVGTEKKGVVGGGCRGEVYNIYSENRVVESLIRCVVVRRREKRWKL
jgi:hypothetical protein